MQTLLLTRPKPQAEAFLAAVEAASGHAVPHVLSPLIRIEPTGAALPATGELVFTSGRAVQLAGGLTGRRAYCVGDVTAALARAAGAEALSASGDVAALYELILRNNPGDLIHLRGEDTAGALVERLRAAGLRAEQRILYRAVPMVLNDEAKLLFSQKTMVVAPVFSPRSARILADQVDRPPDRVIAISAAAAQPFAGLTEVSVAATPDLAGMIEAVVRRLGNLS